MLFELFVFLITFILTFSSFSVVTAKNPVHAVFFLILTFSLSALFLLLFSVEFLALLFIVVYVGAIAVLFLFVVMMLDLRQTFHVYNDHEVYGKMSINLFLVTFFVFLLVFIQPLWSLSLNGEDKAIFYLQYINLLDDFSNIQIIGDLLYTFYSPVFILAGYLLLLAMLGSIMLTLKNHLSNRRQFSFVQLQRDSETTIKKYQIKV